MRVANRGILLVLIPFLCQAGVSICFYTRIANAFDRYEQQSRTKQLVSACQLLMADLSESTLSYLYQRKHIHGVPLDTTVPRQRLLDKIDADVKLVERATGSKDENYTDIQEVRQKFDRFRSVVQSEEFRNKEEMSRDLWFFLGAIKLLEPIAKISESSELELKRVTSANSASVMDLQLSIGSYLVLTLLLSCLTIVASKKAIVEPLVNAKSMSIQLAEGKAIDKPKKTNSEFDGLYEALITADTLISDVRKQEQDLAENTPALIFLIDRNLEIVYANKTALECLKQNSISGLSVLDLIGDEDRESLSSLLLGLSEDLPQTIETILTVASDRSGHEKVEVRASFALNSFDQKIFCVMQDITQQKQLQRAKQDFIGLVSGDMVAPLVSSSLILESLSKNSSQTILKSDFEMLQMTSSKLSELLKSVLQIVGDDERRNCLVEDAFRLSTELIAGRIESSELHLELRADSGGAVKISCAELTRIILNFLTNAVKNSPPGSRLIVTGQLTNSRMVEIGVHDSGPGIPVELRASIFEPFNRGDVRTQREKGTGLGLAIVKDLVTENGGTFGIRDSEILCGSCFWIQLQVSDA